jgi:hypothetical protein
MLKGGKGSQHQGFRDFLQHSRSKAHSSLYSFFLTIYFFLLFELNICTILNVEGFSQKARYIKGFRPFNIHSLFQPQPLKCFGGGVFLKVNFQIPKEGCQKCKPPTGQAPDQLQTVLW